MGEGHRGGNLQVRLGTVILALWAVGEVAAQGVGGLGGFGGPSILGRGGSGGGRKGDGLRIRPHLGVQAIYDSGLTSVTPGASGEIFTRGAAGIEILGGVYGTKRWKRNQLQLSYTGDYRHYRNFTPWNGTDQSLSLSYGTILTKKLSLQGDVSAGTTNRAFGGVVNTGGFQDFGAGGLAPSSLFDVRMNYGAMNGALTYNLSNRTSISLSGGGYTLRRRNRALFGVDGVQARGDLARRINKRTSIGIDYNFSTFQFSRAFGDTYVHGVGGFVARQFGRDWELNLRLGALNVETLGQRTVQIDPAIAAIIGITSGQEVFYSNNILGSGTVSLLRRTRSGGLSFSYTRGVNPGNGIILTAQTDTAAASYTRRLSRKLNTDFSYNYSRMRGIGLILGDFKAHTGGVGLGWQVTRWSQITARFDRRNATTTGGVSAFNLNGNRLAFGVTFTPADLPLSIW